MKTTQDKIQDFYDFMSRVVDTPLQSTETITEDDDGYELDEDGNRLSCCGDILDPDIMLCPSCKEHC
jgi:hypothetical protein